MGAWPREKPKANGRPLQHTPSTRKPGDGNCGEMRARLENQPPLPPLDRGV